MKLYGAVTKVKPQDDGAINVNGVASSGAVDDADEQVPSAEMKAALPAYMRFGALCEMHGLWAAGATLSAEVGEDGATRIEALVVDPVAVKKVRLGVYLGFSIGGRVLARDPADRKVITKTLDEWMRHRLRAIQLKHWKRGTTMYRELLVVGAKPELARRIAANSRCWWRNSGMALNAVLTREWLADLGAPSLS